MKQNVGWQNKTKHQNSIQKAKSNNYALSWCETVHLQMEAERQEFLSLCTNWWARREGGRNTPSPAAAPAPRGKPSKWHLDIVFSFWLGKRKEQLTLLFQSCSCMAVVDRPLWAPRSRTGCLTGWHHRLWVTSYRDSLGATWSKFTQRNVNTAIAASC